MILYPFPPGSALKCGIAGFDEEKREPAAELYLLAPGAVPPAEFDGGYLFCEAPGCRDTRLLQPVHLAPIRMLFPVPCPSGVGTPLDETAADALTARHPSHFSPELVCRYCFFRDEDGDAHVFLYDTEETCREKLNLLRRLGVRRVFGEIPQT